VAASAAATGTRVAGEGQFMSDFLMGGARTRLFLPRLDSFYI